MLYRVGIKERIVTEITHKVVVQSKDDDSICDYDWYEWADGPEVDGDIEVYDVGVESIEPIEATDASPEPGVVLDDDAEDDGEEGGEE
jgi:hypothetical protein